MITAAPQRQVQAEDDGLNLSINWTWGISGTDRLPLPPSSMYGLKGDWKVPALGAQVGVQPEDSFPELPTHHRDERLGTTPLPAGASTEGDNQLIPWASCSCVA